MNPFNFQEIKYSSDDITVSENFAGKDLGSFMAFDPDKEDTHTFELTNDGGGKFVVDTTGKLSTAAGLFFQLKLVLSELVQNVFDKI